MRGSITKRTGPRGTSWYAVVDVGRDPTTGERRQKRVSAPTRKECEALVRDTIRAAESGAPAALSRLKVRDYLDKWLASVEPTLRPDPFTTLPLFSRRRQKLSKGKGGASAEAAAQPGHDEGPPRRTAPASNRPGDSVGGEGEVGTRDPQDEGFRFAYLTDATSSPGTFPPPTPSSSTAPSTVFRSTSSGRP